MAANLIFEDLTLWDFKSFLGKHQFELSRKPGLYFVKGDNQAEVRLGANGAGKSSIWDALVWCLTGTTIKDTRPGDAIEPWSGGKPLVELQFRRGGRHYRLGRGRLPNKLYLSVDDAKKENIVQGQIPAILGMSDEAFKRTVVIGQVGALFMDMKPEQQMLMFSEMLGLEIWLAAAQAAAKKAIATESRRSELERLQASAESALETLARVLADLELDSSGFEDGRATHLEELEAAVQQAKDALDNHSDSKGQNQKELERCNKAFDDAKKALSDQIALCSEASAKLSKQRELFAGLKADAENLKRDVDKYAPAAKGDDPVCPDCNQVVDRKHLRAKLKEAERLYDAKAKEMEEARAAGLALADAASDCEKEYRRLDKVMEAQRKAMWDAQSLVEGEKRQRVQLEDDIKQAQADCTKAKDEANPYTPRIAQNKKSIKEQEAALEDIVKKLAGIDDTIATFKYWAKAYKEIRLQLIEETLAELELASNRHADALGLQDWEMRFVTEKETLEGKVSLGFSVLVRPLGSQRYESWKSYSGGESQRWQLAVTFALSEVLLGRSGLLPNMEVLDEPTRGMSPAGLQDLLECLKQRAQDMERAIYFVDHHSLDRGEFDGVIKVVKDPDGRSRIED
jgi:DNA repair exonuclease SbcCD ATPase subunit